MSKKKNYELSHRCDVCREKKFKLMKDIILRELFFVFFGKHFSTLNKEGIQDTKVYRGMSSQQQTHG
jgi:hypothetical protein